MERGTVSMRVAFVLRSAEVQPLFRDLCEVCKKKLVFFLSSRSLPLPLFLIISSSLCHAPKNWCVIGNNRSQPLWMPCVQNKQFVSVPGIDLLSGKEHPGSFGRHNTTQHNNQPILFSLFDEEERMRKHEDFDEEEA